MYIYMQNGIADTNPFKRLAEQEREQNELGQVNRINEQTSGSQNFKPKLHSLRPPIPTVPSVITTHGHNSPIDESGDDYSNFVDSYADTDSAIDDNDSSSDDDDDEVLQPIDLDRPILSHSKPERQFKSNMNQQQKQPQLQIPILPDINHSEDMSQDKYSLDDASLSATRAKNVYPELTRYEPSTEFVDHTQLKFDKLAHRLQQALTIPSSQITLTPPLSQPTQLNQEFTQISPQIQENHVLPVSSNIPVTERYPLTSTISNSQSNSTMLRSNSISQSSGQYSQPENDTSDGLPITIDPSTFPDSSYNNYSNNNNSNSFEEEEEEDTPVTPKRPPQLPNRRSSQRLSNLDPGSSSTVNSYSFYVNHENNEQDNAPLIPTRVYTPNQRTDQNNSPYHLNNTQNSPSKSVNQSHLQHSPSFSRPPIPTSQNFLASQETGSSAISNSSSPSLSQSYNPTQHVENLCSTISSVSQSVTGSRISLPVITVTPILPKKPLLPKRPPRLSSGSASAYELLENYGRRSSVTQPTPFSINYDTQPQETSETNIQSRINVNLPDSNNDDLDLESLRNLGITDEMIRQQREIEARIKSDQLKQRPSIESSDRDRMSLPSINISSENQQINNESTSNESIISNVSGGSEEILNDVTQLEIPNNMSRSNSISSDNSNENSTLSGNITTDISFNQEMTEGEFLESLPQVPKYTEEADITEISIPNGMAINIETINDNHPDFDPPGYTSVSDALKKIINRPQFSQTGGDTLSIRRREQERLRMEEEERQRQNRESSRSSGSSSTTSRRQTVNMSNPESNSSSSSSISRTRPSSTRVTSTSRKISRSTRRLPPAPSTVTR